MAPDSVCVFTIPESKFSNKDEIEYYIHNAHYLNPLVQYFSAGNVYPSTNWLLQIHEYAYFLKFCPFPWKLNKQFLLHWFEASRQWRLGLL